MSTQKQVTAWELVDIGIEHPQYFQGFDTVFTDYTDCAVGVGQDPREALDDCLENLVQQDYDVEELEKQILAKYPDFNNGKVCAGASVEAYLRKHSPESVDADTDEIDYDGCELWYYVGIRVSQHHTTN